MMLITLTCLSRYNPPSDFPADTAFLLRRITMNYSIMTQHLRRLLGTTLAILAIQVGSTVLANAQSTPEKVPLTHEAMWMMKRVGEPNPSPDGRWVVFSMVEPAYDEKDQVSDLWIVTSDSTGARSPQWRPDGKAILFTSTVFPGATDEEANRKMAAERKAQKYR